MSNQFKIGDTVKTKFGIAEITVIDQDYKAVKVKHLEDNTPITDFYFDEIQLVTDNNSK